MNFVVEVSKKVRLFQFSRFEYRLKIYSRSLSVSSTPVPPFKSYLAGVVEETV